MRRTDRSAPAAVTRDEGREQRRGASVLIDSVPTSGAAANSNGSGALVLGVQLTVDAESVGSLASMIHAAVVQAMAAQAPSSPWVDSDGIAQHLGCSRAKVDRLARDHGLPYSMLGDTRRYSIAAVDAWLAQRTGEGVR